MAIIDLIAEERKRYLSSAQTRCDWIRYLTAVEGLRRRHHEESPAGDPGEGA
jgi:hypothetical protein